jgi:hypothetical protein
MTQNKNPIKKVSYFIFWSCYYISNFAAFSITQPLFWPDSHYFSAKA